MVGRPTLEKCAQIRRRREFEEELREIDPRNIIDSRLRSSASGDRQPTARSALVVSSDDESVVSTSDGSDESE